MFCSEDVQRRQNCMLIVCSITTSGTFKTPDVTNSINWLYGVNHFYDTNIYLLKIIKLTLYIELGMVLSYTLDKIKLAGN